MMPVDQVLDLLQVAFPGAWSLSDRTLVRTVGDVTITVGLHRDVRGVFPVSMEAVGKASYRTFMYTDEVPRIIRALIVEVFTDDPSCTDFRAWLGPEALDILQKNAFEAQQRLERCQRDLQVAETLAKSARSALLVAEGAFKT
jgi:hypothetical protein